MEGRGSRSTLSVEGSLRQGSGGLLKVEVLVFFCSDGL